MRAQVRHSAREPLSAGSRRDLWALPDGSRVLLAVTDRIGDALFRTPAIRLLNRVYPRIRFDALAFGPGAELVLNRHPGLKRVHRLTDARDIRALAERYDLLLNTRSSNLRRYLSRVQTPMIQHRRIARQAHKAEDLLGFVQTLLPAPVPLRPADCKYVLPVEDGVPARLWMRLRREAGLEPEGECLIGLHPGCASLEKYKPFFSNQSWVGHKKTWPARRFADLAVGLVREDPGRRILILGSQAESFLGRRLAQRIPRAVNLCGRLSLTELAALMDRLTLLICNDSGPMHVACARETPVLGLFGATNPERTGPFPRLPQFRVITGAGMNQISVEEVLEEARHMLGRCAGDHAPPSVPGVGLGQAG